MSEDDNFRRHAEDCRQRAQIARTTADRAGWLLLAQSWLLQITDRTEPDYASEAFDAEQTAHGTGQDVPNTRN
jgi:hypothetical protein